MAVAALHQHRDITGIGGKRACRNVRHRYCRTRRDCKRHGDKACFDKSSHWDLLHRASRRLAQVPKPSFVPRAALFAPV
jgi:hypothetical protein